MSPTGVHTIDANGAAVGHTFLFLAVHGAAFSGVKGQLRWFQENPAGTVNDKTIVEGDINGYKLRDFQIELVCLKVLTAADFVLYLVLDRRLLAALAQPSP